MKNYLVSEKGFGTVFTLLFLLAMLILLTCFMTWAGTEITMLRVRNAMKAELNNLAVRISEDTYHAMREGDLDAYYHHLTTSAVYQNELLSMVREHLSESVAEESKTYKLSGLQLTFRAESEAVVYTLTCSVDCYLSLFGAPITIRADALSLSGLHNTKVYS